MHETAAADLAEKTSLDLVRSRCRRPPICSSSPEDTQPHPPTPIRADSAVVDHEDPDDGAAEMATDLLRRRRHRIRTRNIRMEAGDEP